MQDSSSLQKDVTDSPKGSTGCSFINMFIDLCVVFSITIQYSTYHTCSISTVLGELSPSQVQPGAGVHDIKNDAPCLAGTVLPKRNVALTHVSRDRVITN